MIWKGVALALCAACTHSVIDVFRKACANVGIPTVALVSLPAILDGITACTGVYLTGGFQLLDFQDRSIPFTLAIATTSALLLYSKVLYQRALHLSPLSLTIPYLSFTPAFLIITAFIFVGEIPSPSGLAGVSIVACGGYLLSSRTVTASTGQTSASPPSPTMSRTSSNSGLTQMGGNQDEVSTSGVVKCSSTLQGIFGISSRMSYMQLKGMENAERTPQRAPKGTMSQTDMESLNHISPGHAAQPEKRKTFSMATAGGIFQEPGTLLMLGVAIMWSVTASLDKFGIMHSPTVWVYFAAQRATIAVAATVLLVYQSPEMFSFMLSHFWRLLGISCLELASVVLFLEAIKYIYVSYVVAIKRCNILISVLMGGLLFKENIKSRIPCVCICVLGMCLIVLEPNASSFHHNHHT